MSGFADEQAIRYAALAWLEQQSHGGELPMTRDQLANDFYVGGERFALVDRGRGIRKPAGWTAALSIMTAVPRVGRPRPYDDIEGLDGLHRYQLRRDEGGRAENEGLRAALAQDQPLAWFYGIEPGVFHVISPVYLRREEPEQAQFALALTEAQRLIEPGSVIEERVRRYLIAQTKQRLHQPVFAAQVMRAYQERCAVCSLGHRALLDAAHIIGDAKPRGEPVVPNGLALCKIHHAAYDQNILGIRPDYVVEIHQRLLDEIDGPMLRHGLQGRHHQSLLVLPRAVRDQPDRSRLEERYVEFRATA